MPNRGYEKGVRLERRVMEDMSKAGWRCVRAAGSKGETKADVVAFHPDGRMALIQCKADGKISPGEWNTIYTVAGFCRGGLALLASTDARGRLVYERLDDRKIPRSRTRPCTVYDVKATVVQQGGEIPCQTSSDTVS